MRPTLLGLKGLDARYARRVAARLMRSTTEIDATVIETDTGAAEAEFVIIVAKPDTDATVAEPVIIVVEPDTSMDVGYARRTIDREARRPGRLATVGICEDFGRGASAGLRAPRRSRARARSRRTPYV